MVSLFLNLLLKSEFIFNTFLLKEDKKIKIDHFVNF